METKPETTFDTFAALDIRKGTVIRAEPNAGAKKPAFGLWVDFGAGVGVRQSSAQLTRHYTAESSVGTAVLGVVNFAPRRIAGFVSEVLILGTVNPDDSGDVILVRPDADCANGSPLG